MADNDNLDLDTELHEKEGSLRRGWPALLLTVGMVSAAVYAFSPRHYPPFPETRIHAGDIIAESVARQDGRFIAVGELGHILTTTNPRGDWRAVDIGSERSATLTRVAFVAEDVAVAVGHSGWIVRSEDGGRTWNEIRFDEQSADPLLGIAGPFDGKLYAVGSFGQYFVSRDLGRTWTKQDPQIKKSADAGKADAGKNTKGDSASGSEEYDPFADFESGGGVQALAKEHYYDVAQSTDGTLFLVGERGLIARSRDGGDNWNRIPDIYDGSFYGALALPDDRVLVYGMRGHAFVTDDGGRTWARSDIPVEQSLFGGIRTEDGRIVLVGSSNTVLVSNDGGRSFSRVAPRGTADLASILPLSDGAWLTAGVAGVQVESLSMQEVAAEGERS